MSYLDRPRRSFEEAFEDVRQGPDWLARPLITQMRIAREAVTRRLPPQQLQRETQP